MDRIKWLLRIVLLGVVLDLAIAGTLIQEERTIVNNQSQIHQVDIASQCWDRILTRALHDHLTTAQRNVLISDANRCADLSK